MAEYTPSGTIRGLTEEDANKLALSWSKLSKKAREALNYALNWPKGEDTRGVMSEGEPDPRSRTGLGDFMFGKGPEVLENSAYGLGNPWGMAENGPPFPYLRRGKGQEAADLISTLPIGMAADVATGGQTGMTATIPAIAGVIRRKGDNITPQVASRLAESLVEKPVKQKDISSASGIALQVTPTIGPPHPSEDTALAEEIQSKLARYIQRSAGTETDPLQGQRLWAPPESGGWYDVSKDPMEPLGPNDFMRGASRLDNSAKMVEQDPARAELVTPTGSMGKTTDELAAVLLQPGMRARSDYETASVLKSLPPELLNNLDNFYRQNADAYIPRSAGRASLVERVFKEAEGDLATSGVAPEKLADVLKTMPEGTALGIPKMVDEGTFLDSGLTNLATMLNNPGFRDVVGRIPADKRAQMDFPRLIQQADTSLTKALKDYEQSLIGPVVHKYPDGMTWQKLDRDELLRREGVKQNICVGQESYCKAVKNGTMEIFSLRGADNKPAVTMSFHVKEAPAKILQDPFAAGTPIETVWKDIIGNNLGIIGNREMADWVYYAGLTSSAAKRLLRFDGADLPSGQDFENLQRALVRGIADRNAGKHTDQSKLTEMLGMKEVPNPDAGKKAFELDQIKGKNNRYATDWSQNEQDLWVPKIKELLDKSGVSASESTDGRAFNRALESYNRRQQQNTKPRALKDIPLSEFADNAVAPEGRNLEAPDGTEVFAVDGPHGYAYWQDEDGELWAAPRFDRGDRVDFDNAGQVGDWDEGLEPRQIQLIRAVLNGQ